MESINIKILNAILSESNRSKYFISEQKGHQGIRNNSDGEQDEYNETHKYYRHPEMPENVFLQVTYRTDSYGDNDRVFELKLVQGKAKQITVYEPI